MTNLRLACAALTVFASITLLTLKPFAQTPPASHSSSNSAAKQESAAQPATDTITPTRLNELEKEIKKEAAEAHVVGASLVVVKDGRVIFLKGIGMRDLEHKKLVTPDTLFAIGSSSKAITAMTMMMSVDEGKLSLTDPPRKYLPYFKLRDPDADSKITISDLMCHRSGLPRTDLAWSTGKLTSEEIIRVAGLAKPTAKLGEKFQYQNVMFLAAGQIVGAVQHKPWTDVVAEKIFQPLGMTRTETSIDLMQKDADYSLGYAWDEDKLRPYHLPMRNLECIAPAGAINSSARDMSRWVTFMLNRGVWNGKRLVSEKSYGELFKKRITVAGKIGYGYGWMLRDWHGHSVMEHGGNIDGFSAEVALMPDSKLGFALLTNANISLLASSAVDSIFDTLLGAPKKPDSTVKAAPASDPSREVGIYRLNAANLDLTVEFKDNGLTLTVPGQPTYKLESEGGRKYRLAGLSGFTATFRDAKTDAAVTEVAMSQPQGDFVAVRRANSAPEPPYNGPMKELLGTYENETPHIEFTVTAKQGKVCFVVPGQPPYPLVSSERANAKDHYRLGELPESFGITISRGADGKVTGMELKQPQGNLHLVKQADAPTGISGDEVMAKVLEASGGESNLRKHHSMKLTISSDLESQGVKAETVEYNRAPLSGAKVTRIVALGKTIATSREYFNGANGGSVNSLAPYKPFGEKELAQARFEADMYAVADWRQRYKSIVVMKTAKLNGEGVYVLKMTPVDSDVPPNTAYVSTKTYLILKREQSSPSAVGPIPVSVTYSDYRDVDGVKIAFKRTSEALDTISVDTVDKVEFDVVIPDKVFRP